MPRRASSLRSRVPRFVFAVLLLMLACAGAAKADGFQNGQFVTYDSGAWVFPISGPGATLLVTDYGSVYAGSSGVLTLGLPNTGFTLSFDGAGPVFAFLPAVGPPLPLNNNYLDPSNIDSIAGSPGNFTSTSFASDVLALQLNVDFSNAGFLAHPAGIPFGSLVLQNLNGAIANLDGLTISQFLAGANTCLGGGTCVDSPANLDAVAAALNLSFEGGVPNSGLFTQTNLALPGSVTPTPEPSSVLLLGFGLLGLVGFAFRRRRVNAVPYSSAKLRLS